MTSYDASAPDGRPAPGPQPARRRALGRGPGTAPDRAEPDAGQQGVPDPAPMPEPEPAGEDALPGRVSDVEEPGRDGASAGSATEPETGGTDVSTDVPGLPGDATAAGGLDAVEGGPVAAGGDAGTVDGEAGAAEGGGDADGRFKVRLANFEGPFDLLLQLIAKHKLDVTEVALSRVTDEFMAYIRAMGPDWDLDETTEFLVVAATLLDLKAARLLPAAEVEDEADLALLEARDLLFARLLQYRAYKQIADIFSRRLDDEARRYPRTVGLEPQHADLLPEVVISIGPEGFAKLAVKAMQPKPKPQVYVDHIHAPLVSVQEQAGIVVARLRELGEASFRALVEDTDDTLTVVARFLALLELYREKAVALEQETALGELLVRWTGGEGDAQPRVTDEFDRPPEKAGEEKKP
ncbi:segregation and condensation protein A [Streptomyces griseosporeus]|uniref:segregation and condensation protein A n=1 Tax=Streptomyces griseosporeus TaxID=1910 RepID=UPI0036FE7CB6